MPDARLAQSIFAILQVVSLGLLVMLPLGTAERVESEAVAALGRARDLQEAAAERAGLLEELTRSLVQLPVDPPGWNVGVRQVVAYAALPGDTCQLLVRPDGTWLLALVDIAGHGPMAAFHALRIRSGIDALWTAGEPILQIVEVTNRGVEALGTIATGVFVTFDADRGWCSYVNAGHPAPVVMGGSGTSLLHPTGPLLGLPEATWEVETISIARGACLVAYTDGLTEARDVRRRFLGDDIVELAMKEHLASGPQAVADRCVDAALGHAAGRLTDDAVVIALERR